MSKSMIKQTKQTLEKVSFDPVLFSKELLKAIKFLLIEELEELAKWFVDFTKRNPQLKNLKISTNDF